MAQIPTGHDSDYYMSGRALALYLDQRPLPSEPPIGTPAWWANEGLKDVAAGLSSRTGKEASPTDKAVAKARADIQPPDGDSSKIPASSNPVRDAAIIVTIKARLRAALLKKVPGFLSALISDAQPSPAEQKRFDDYKRDKDILRAAEAIEGAVTAVVAAINPLAGAIVGLGVAAVSATQEVMAKEIENYIAPWQKKDAGLTTDYAVKALGSRVYNYRGFSSIGYGSGISKTYGIWRNQENALAMEDSFDDYVDGLLQQAGKALRIDSLHRYFPINLVTESFALEDRDQERIVTDSQGFRDLRGRIAAQYAPDELEKIVAETVLATESRK